MQSYEIMCIKNILVILKNIDNVVRIVYQLVININN